MPTSFTTYWGSNIHGIEIKWTCDTTASPVVLHAEYTSNYYWRMQLYYNGTVANAANDLALLASLDTVSGVGAVAGGNFGTDMKASIPSAGLNPCVSSCTSVEYEAIANRDKFKMQFMIANPTSGATVPYDGFNGRTWFTAQTGSNDGVTMPSVFVEWMRSTDGTSPGTAHMYDLKPSSATDETVDTVTDNWTTLATEAKHLDGSDPVDGTKSNLCKEQWTFSNTSVACVKVTGTASRDMTVSAVTSSNPTADTTEDFDIDFVDHQISTQFGKDAKTMSSDTLIQFAAIKVSFSTFLESETAGGMTLLPCLFTTALTLFTAF